MKIEIKISQLLISKRKGKSGSSLTQWHDDLMIMSKKTDGLELACHMQVKNKLNSAYLNYQLHMMQNYLGNRPER